jgi:hypothetical protein
MPLPANQSVNENTDDDNAVPAVIAKLNGSPSKTTGAESGAPMPRICEWVNRLGEISSTSAWGAPSVRISVDRCNILAAVP